MPIEPQKSEVHATTGDASTTPTGGGDQETTRRTPSDRPPDGRRGDAGINPEPPTDVRIVSDETDDAGPLVIQSSDPDLNPPRTPKDPFPTERKPEIDPPVKK
jgi:hypothetical protein